MLHTTFRLARKAKACKPQYQKFAASVGGVETYGLDTPIPLSQVLEVNGLQDALWCLRAVLPEEEAARDRLARLFSCVSAEHVAPLWVAPAGIDWLPADTISVSRRYALGQATKAELEAARVSALVAWDAKGATRGTRGVAMASAWTAMERAIDAAHFAAEEAWRATFVTAAETGWEIGGAAEGRWQHEQFAAMLAA